MVESRVLKLQKETIGLTRGDVELECPDIERPCREKGVAAVERTQLGIRAQKCLELVTTTQKGTKGLERDRTRGRLSNFHQSYLTL